MTRNQLQYQKNFEDRRHNRELEAQGLSQIGVNQLQAQAALGQAAASQSQASTAAYRAAEEARHNLVAERQNRAKLIVEGVDTGMRTVGNVAKIAAKMS